jgi:3-hydroxymyristoyl/3-hydroxydecanoyl-(acyl carrier protein) dehydratase
MENAGFRSRPVAGITGEFRIKEDAASGTVLDLEVELESCDSDAILYGGLVRVEGRPIVELSRCVGPMLPMEDFDDPEAVRQRFELLCGAGAPPQNFSGEVAPSPRVIVIDHNSGKGLRAEMQVPSSAPFFADHFPRRPVFPGTLFMDAILSLAVRLGGEVVDPSVRTLLRTTRISNAKLRSFLSPGQSLEIAAEIVTATRNLAEIMLVSEIQGQRVSTVRVETGLREES